MVNGVCIDVARIHSVKHDAMVENIWNSDYLNYISAIASGTATDSTSLIYVNLSKGNLEEALRGSAFDPATYAFVLRLVAASDGASDEMIQKCLALKPEDGTNMHSITPTIGLYARSGRDIKPYMDLLERTPRQPTSINLKRF